VRTVSERDIECLDPEHLHSELREKHGRHDYFKENLCRERAYPFDAVFGPQSTNVTVFEQLALPLVPCAVTAPQLLLRARTPLGRGSSVESKGEKQHKKLEAVAKQPVSIAIEADQQVFQLYRGGVLTGACGTQLDHGVLLVGYGSEQGQDYWLIKNSWGSSWGEEGFGKLLRGQSGAGECGIKMNPSFPVVKAAPGPAPGPSPGPSPPSPPSPPPSPSSPHYEKPPCQADEQSVQVQGLQGVTCSPKCQGTSCPTDVPAGTEAKPQCVLQDTAGDKYCALTCFLGGCPPGATCRHSGFTGLCMYDADAEERAHSLPTTVVRGEEIINLV